MSDRRSSGRRVGRPLGAKDLRPRKKQVFKARVSGQKVAIEVERDEDDGMSEFLSFRDSAGNMATMRFASAAEKNRAIEAAQKNHSTRKVIDEDERELVVGDMQVTSVRDRAELKALRSALVYCCGIEGAAEVEKEAKRRLGDVH